MSSRGQDSPERTQSKFDDALLQYKEHIERLGSTLVNLENRLGCVMNDYPRPNPGEMERDAQNKPSGDSALLSQLYSLNASLSTQIDRIQDLIGRLDI